MKNPNSEKNKLELQRSRTLRTLKTANPEEPGTSVKEIRILKRLNIEKPKLHEISHDYREKRKEMNPDPIKTDRV